MRAAAPPSTTPFPWIGLVVIAALIFTSVTSEFLPTGLLPDISSDLDASESQVGFLITVFAGTVVLSAAPLTIVTRDHSRKALVIVVLLVFVLSNIMAALAPSYAVLVIARVLGGLAHGLFWAVVGAYAAHLVPPHQLGRAVAITSTGGTVAFVLGVPLGTALGHALGWRLAFIVIAGVILALTAVAAKLLPAVEHRERLTTGEIPLPMHRDRTLPPVILVWAIVVLIGLAHNILYTYVVPFLISIDVSDDAVAGVLFLYGGAGAVGLLLAGVLGDRWPRGWLVTSTALLAVSLLVLGTVTGALPISLIAFVVWGMAFGGLPAMLQARMLRAASPRVRDIGAAGFTTAFNFSIGIGAFAGGVILDSAGVGALPFVDLSITVVGIVVILTGALWLRRRDAARSA
jgi:predicted MFS family arabinose efflux permease